MISVAVGYGYWPQQSDPAEWRADALAYAPEDLLTLLHHWIISECGKSK